MDCLTSMYWIVGLCRWIRFLARGGRECVPGGRGPSVRHKAAETGALLSWPTPPAQGQHHTNTCVQITFVPVIYLYVMTHLFYARYLCKMLIRNVYDIILQMASSLDQFSYRKQSFVCTQNIMLNFCNYLISLHYMRNWNQSRWSQSKSIGVVTDSKVNVHESKG